MIMVHAKFRFLVSCALLVYAVALTACGPEGGAGESGSEFSLNAEKTAAVSQAVADLGASVDVSKPGEGRAVKLKAGPSAKMSPPKPGADMQPYHVGVEINGQSRSVAAQVTPELRGKLLKSGFAELKGEEAIKGFLSEAVQSMASQGKLDPDRVGVLMVAPGGSRVDAEGGIATNSATCCDCYDVFSCYWTGSYWLCTYLYSYCHCYSC
jgi:hypothetical protein